MTFDAETLLSEAERTAPEAASSEEIRALARAVRQAPASAEAWNALGTGLVRGGRPEQALAAYRHASLLDPTLFKPHNNLGNLLLERGEVGPAVACLRRAADLAPDNPRVRVNLGNALAAANDDAGAAAAFARAMELSPSWKAAHNLGLCLARLGETDRAEGALRDAARLDASAVVTHVALGELLASTGRRREAGIAFDLAADALGDDVDAAAGLVKLLGYHQYDRRAITLAERHLQRRPGHEGLLILLVSLLERNGALGAAEPLLVRAFDAPEGPGPWIHLARLRAQQGRFDDEARMLEQAAARYPDHPAGKVQLARRRTHEQRLDEAETLLLDVLAKDPTQDALDALAFVRLDLGDARGAMELIERAEAQRASKGFFNASLAPLVANYLDCMPADRLAEAHVRWAKLALPDPTPLDGVTSRAGVEGRPLRVGYVSPDFRRHPVATFVEPVLMAHDRRDVEIFCYSTATRPADDVSQRIAAMDLRFRELGRQSAANIARAIADDRIDVLVDLAGWTTDGRLDVFRLRPAPVQVTWLGYPNTTGIREMDYRITDPWADPPGAEALYVERLFRLDRAAWAFRPVRPAPPPRAAGAPPAPLRFGSLNNLCKVSEATLDAWAEILRRTPGAGLLLKAKQLRHGRARERILGALSARGVDPGRVELLGAVADYDAHLATYDRIDVALDTFPYNGTTTTCEALWMGVPVVSVAGAWPASRVGASLLRAAGRQDLLTSSPADYVVRALELSADRGRLERLRASLRGEVAASELGDVGGLTRALETAYRTMAADGMTRDRP